MRKTSVLFVCIHNSARSQMAEAFLKRIGGEAFEVESAGIEPGKLNPLAVEAMRLAGVDIGNASTQGVFDLFKESRLFNYVITVCDEASAERCPVFPGVTKRLAWSFPDPSSFEGRYDERLEQTLRVRDQIRDRVRQWVDELKQAAPGLADRSP